MAAITAHVLIGHPHPNDGGIRASHQIEVSEGSRPALLLYSSTAARTMVHAEQAIWIPSSENTLDDVVLMAAVCVAESPSVLALVAQHCPVLLSRRVEMHEQVPMDVRGQLYEACKALEDFPKLVFSIFRGSLLKASVGHLQDYRMDAEVCPSLFYRGYNRWSGKVDTQGGFEFLQSPGQA